ncbi:spidroin 3A variant 1, partial [Trichonephila clavata]
MDVHSKDNARFPRNVKAADDAGMKRRNGFSNVVEDKNGINPEFDDTYGKSDKKRLRDNEDPGTISQTSIGDGFPRNGNDQITFSPDDGIGKSSFRLRKKFTFRSNDELDNTGLKFKTSLENFGQSNTGKDNLGAKTLADKDFGKQNKSSFQSFFFMSKTEYGGSGGLNSKVIVSKKTENKADLKSGNDNTHESGDLSGGLGFSQAVKLQEDKKQGDISQNAKDNHGKGFETTAVTHLGQGVGGNAALKGKVNFESNNNGGIISPHSVSAQIKSNNGHENGGILDSFAVGKHIEFGHNGELVNKVENGENEHGKIFGSGNKPDLGVNSDSSRNSRVGTYTFQGKGTHFDTGHVMNSPHGESSQTQNEDGHVSEHVVNSYAQGKHAEFGYNGELVDSGQSVMDDHGTKFASKDKTHLGQTENLGVKFGTARSSRVRNLAIPESGADFEGNTGNGMTSHHSISIQAENVNEQEIKDIFDSFGLGKLMEFGNEGDNGKNNKDGNGKKFGSRDEINANINSHVRNDAIL